MIRSRDTKFSIRDFRTVIIYQIAIKNIISYNFCEKGSKMRKYVELSDEENILYEDKEILV